MTTIRDFLNSAKLQLVKVADNPQLESEILCAHVLQQPRSFLYAHADKRITDIELAELNNCLLRRLSKEPIAYITGKKEFWSLELSVNVNTLIPRPETELLVERALSLFPKESINIKVADLGTGSGAIAVALGHERPMWQIYATDNCLPALEVAKMNAQQLALKNVFFASGDWCNALSSFNLRDGLDAIISNPPYIADVEWDDYSEGLAFEPRGALTSGADGLDAIRQICQQARAYLKPGGYLLIEHGYAQAQSVRAMFADAGYGEATSWLDLFGNERVSMCRRTI